MKLNDICGYYNPSFFNMVLETDESISGAINKYSATFTHEFIHYIQDIIFSYNIRLNLSRLSWFSNIRQSANRNGYITCPFNDWDSDSQTFMTKSIHRKSSICVMLIFINRFMLHVNKTPHSILDFLKDNGIVMENCDGPQLNMRTSDAQIYMAILAKYLARIEGHTDIGTDIDRTFFYPHIRMSRRDGIDRQIYLDMALQEILPIPNMDDISLESIIDFRNEHKQELLFFRRRIDLFQDRLRRQTEDVEELLEQTERFGHEIDQDLQLIDELLQTEAISFRRACLRTLLPIGLNAGVGIAASRGHLTETQAKSVVTLGNAAISLFSAKESTLF